MLGGSSESASEEDLRHLVRQTLEAIQPKDPSQTTRWSWSFESRSELEEWLRRHRVSQGSLARALQEYDISEKTGTPKKFVINGKRGRGRYVEVFGRRRRSRTADLPDGATPSEQE